MDNRIIDVIEALEKAKRYGILRPEDVDKQLKMNLEKYIEAQFLLCDATLKVSYLASNKMYRIRVPLKVQKELGLRPQYFGATEAVRQGMDEVSLMYSFGWKNRQTAEHYIRAGRTQQSQLAILSKVFDRTAETNLTDCN